ncbi:hypothetical protein NL54_10590 [Pantoea stewartii]|nr:hypothetical protein NL54_10590 [Pantoea stewartii]KHN62780.1 hypothetical protein OI73_10020 [Pantoea stewartii]
MPLTELKVRNAKAAAKPVKMTDGNGMHLLITPHGSKYWRFQYRFGSKQKILALAAGSLAGLGVCAAIGIATAGTVAVVCAAVGSIAGGYVGGKASDSVMDTIYEYMGI